MLPTPALGELVQAAAPIKEPEADRVAEALVNGGQPLRQPSLDRCHGFDARATARAFKTLERVLQRHLGRGVDRDDDRFETGVDHFLNLRHDGRWPGQLPLVDQAHACGQLVVVQNGRRLAGTGHPGQKDHGVPLGIGRVLHHAPKLLGSEDRRTVVQRVVVAPARLVGGGKFGERFLEKV